MERYTMQYLQIYFKRNPSANKPDNTAILL